MSASDDSGKERLLDQLIRIKPREVAGARSANRLGYQRSWAFCLLLTLHRKEEDYAVLMDFHDDVVVLNSALNPTTAEFYQVKSSSGKNWTLAQLIKAEKGAEGNKLSIAGKMYANAVAFPGATKSVNFVSNTPFKVKLKTDPDSDQQVDGFRFEDLAIVAAEMFAQAVQTQHGLAEAPKMEILTSFARHPLPIDEHAKFCQGELSEFLQEKTPGGRFPITPAFRSIIGVVEARTTSEIKPSTHEQMLKTRGITRADFEQMLQAVCAPENDTIKWDDVRAFLIAEGFAMPEVARLRRAWNTFEAQRTDATNVALARLRTLVGTVIDHRLQQGRSPTLRELQETCVHRVRTEPNFTHPFGDDGVFAAALHHFYESDRIQASPTQPPQK